MIIFILFVRAKRGGGKSGKEEDLKAYKKPRNLVLKLNRKAKKNFLKSCISTNDKMIRKKIFLEASQTLFYREGFAIQPKYYVN